MGSGFPPEGRATLRTGMFSRFMRVHDSVLEQGAEFDIISLRSGMSAAMVCGDLESSRAGRLNGSPGEWLGWNCAYGRRSSVETVGSLPTTAMRLAPQRQPSTRCSLCNLLDAVRSS